MVPVKQNAAQQRAPEFPASKATIQKASKAPSVRTGCPTCAMCARIWCCRPVKIRISKRLTAAGADP